MKFVSFIALYATLLVTLLLLAACGPTVNQLPPEKTVTVPKSFQAQLSPVPTTPTLRCGAWTSNNAPNTFSTISVYARLTKDVSPVPGAHANAVAHFKDQDAALAPDTTSDAGGYATFQLSLQGRQPRGTPATIDVTFSSNGSTVQCSTFFTPQ